MSQKTVRTNDLEAGATFLVRGKVAFSRVARQTTDQERQKNNNDRRAKNSRSIDIDKNYTSITICNATVLLKDPQNKSKEEIYASESCYQSSQQDKYPGWNFTAMNKSRNLPSIGVVNPSDPNKYDGIDLKGKELAAGLDVTCVCRVFAGKAGNKGVSLDSVLVNEPIRYYEGKSVDNSLKEFGIVFESVKPAEPPVDANVAGVEEESYVPQSRPSEPVAQTDVSNAAANPNPTFAPATQASPFSSYVSNAAPAPANENVAGPLGGPLGAGAGRTY